MVRRSFEVQIHIDRCHRTETDGSEDSGKERAGESVNAIYLHLEVASSNIRVV